MGKELAPQAHFTSEPHEPTEADRYLSQQEVDTTAALERQGHSREGLTGVLDWWYVHGDFFIEDLERTRARYDAFHDADTVRNDARDVGVRPSESMNVSLQDLSSKLRERFGLERHNYTAPSLIVLDASVDEQGRLLGGGTVETWKGEYLQAFDTVTEAVQDFNARTAAEDASGTDIQQANERVVRPLLVSVSNDHTFQREALMRGANAIPTALDQNDAVRLLALVDRIQASEASLFRENTQERKRAFYTQHEGELNDRAHLTADTEQELAILNDVLSGEQAGADEPLRVLDVGSGTGRIALPLAERYRVTGLEANEAFLAEAREHTEGGRAEFVPGDLIDYKQSVEAEQYDAVTYTWHTLLEAYGPGNTLETLTSAWLALQPGGVLIFDMPTRENKGLEDGWYGNTAQTELEYLAYLMTEDELRFMLKMAGFDEVEVRPWSTRPTEFYPEGMRKWTVVARKAPASEKEKVGGDTTPPTQ